MIWLVIGVLLWTAAHWFKRLTPKARKDMGDAAKGMVAGASFLSIALMVIGYRMADVTVLWSLPTWAVHVNNLLMVIAVLLMGLGSSKSRLNGLMRHPMLTGAAVWAVAHLLVNSDLASLLLFGGIGLWALGSMVLINRAEPKWTPPARGNLRGDLMLVGISAAVFVVIVLLHGWIGPSPFPGA